MSVGTRAVNDAVNDDVNDSSLMGAVNDIITHSSTTGDYCFSINGL